MSGTLPSVLVIIPTFNRAGFLTDAVRSAFSQDYPEVTVAVVDDGSTDDTAVVCASLAKEFPGRLLFQRQENGGCASARNQGMSHLNSHVGFVCFLDSDDRLLPGKLSREVRLLNENPRAGFTYADSVVFDEASCKEHTQIAAAAGRPDRFAIEHFLTNEAKCSAILYRASSIWNKRFREDLRYNEDSEFLQRVAIECQGVYSTQPGCWVRWHSGSKSRNFFEIQKAVLTANQDLLKRYPQFHSLFQEQADKRIRNIRRSLCRHFMLLKEWDQAAPYAVTLLERLFLDMHFNACYRLRRWLGRLFRKMGPHGVGGFL